MNYFIDHLDLHAKGLWFPLVISTLLVIMVLFIPKKKINWKDIYIIFGIIGFATWVCEGLIGRVFDLLDLGDPKKNGARGNRQLYLYSSLPCHSLFKLLDTGK
ncbi:hypothetical protein [Niallia sp. 03133]|uniref:hypothetical protein n=1 Tax=Niallia sp. 03133 TaxID=3458060 RepID=UPI004043F0CF